MTIDDMIAVLQAAKAGKKIQSSEIGKSDWGMGFVRNSSYGARMDFMKYDYRVKPEPREWWLNFDWAEQARVSRSPINSLSIKVREVLE